MLITDSQLQQWNARGLIPGPKEAQEAFLTRVNLPQRQTHSLPQFDIAPDWVPITTSNSQLPPWQGACTWISETDASIQMRKSTLCNYSHNEILHHELTHVGRMAFDEPRFEELLAYRTSPSSFRRYFGPLIEKNSEVILFVCLLLAILLSDIYSLFTQNLSLYLTLSWLKLLPLSLIAYATFRLLRKHRSFKQCLKNLSQTKNPEAVAYRLTDKEITLFSSLPYQEIAEYAKKQECLRWQMIRTCYF